MSATIAPAAVEEIFRKVDATDGSPRALDRIAAEYGLMLAELRALLGRRGAPLVKRPTGVPPSDDRGTAKKAESPSKACSACGEVKPYEDFYEATNTASRRASQCIRCENSRPPTPSKIVRGRARNRAYQLLAKAHADEFKVLYNRELVAAEAEHARLQQAAAGRPDAAIARLKPGPKRKGETDTADRLDVARCPSCHTHHDAEHQCPSCGDTTPESPPTVKLWEVRAWALEQGLAPVPGSRATAGPNHACLRRCARRPGRVMSHQPVHHITVTGGGPFGRAWFECTCGLTYTHASKKAANDAALAHHREAVGCNCTRDAHDPCCIERTTDPDITIRRKAS